mmetsp:Transcript_5303/g.9548  ORF Transcript_5303/g.9548 Transcript_5303/m.9548 type:complete len:153 (-) Transcript_5303:1296-1754(-)
MAAAKRKMTGEEQGGVATGRQQQEQPPEEQGQEKTGLPSTSEQTDGREAEALHPSLLLSPEELAYLQTHRVFTTAQLLQFSKQVEQFRQVNEHTRELRRAIYLNKVLQRNQIEHKKVRLSVRRMTGRWMERAVLSVNSDQEPAMIEGTTADN